MTAAIVYVAENVYFVQHAELDSSDEDATRAVPLDDPDPDEWDELAGPGGYDEEEVATMHGVVTMRGLARTVERVEMFQDQMFMARRLVEILDADPIPGPTPLSYVRHREQAPLSDCRHRFVINRMPGGGFVVQHYAPPAAPPLPETDKGEMVRAALQAVQALGRMRGEAGPADVYGFPASLDVANFVKNKVPTVQNP